MLIVARPAPREVLAVLLVALAWFGGACRKASETEAPKPATAEKGAMQAPEAGAAPAPEAGTAPAAPGADVDVTVFFAGRVPQMPLTKRDADPYCAKTPMPDEEVIVSFKDRLKNVIIRITKGVTGKHEPPPYDETLD